MMNTGYNRWAALRYKWSFQKNLADLLLKRWMEPIVPFLLMCFLFLLFGWLLPSYFSLANLADTGREFSELAFVTLGMAITLVSGGIDLSVSSIFALSDMFALILFRLFGLPIPIVIICTLIFGGILGSFNGLLIGFFKTRAFLTTLVTLIIYRSIVSLLDRYFSVDIVMSSFESSAWDYLGNGSILGVPVIVVVLLVVVIICQLLVTRSRPGWRIVAIGGGRRSARHAGIDLKKMVFSVYVVSGIFSALGGFFYGARLNAATSDTGVGLEISALTAAILGGVSLSGGKGTALRAMIGAIIVMVLTNGLMRLGLSGSTTMTFLGLILILGVGIDVKWMKNLFKAVQKIYVAPTYLYLPEPPAAQPGSGTVFEVNTRLADAEPIALGKVDGPEDVIVDRQGRLYGSDRRGWIVRISGEDFSQIELFARTGGRPLGMALDKEDNIIVCVGGMGLYGVRPDGEVYKLTDETNRTWWRINDDSRMRMADDVDIAPDGKIYFSEATIRYNSDEWAIDGLEARPNGRIICYDPSEGKTKTVVPDIVFPNGVCLSHDAQSIMYAQTWLCRVMRYWIAGPKKGKIEPVLENLPFYVDNINRASDGNYWLASAGMRGPAYNLAMQMPGFRRRLTKRVPPDEWPYPYMDIGTCIKFTDDGQVVESLWDKEGKSHPTITSVREDKGYLYIASIFNNRLGRLKLEGADPNWTGPESYWGKK